MAAEVNTGSALDELEAVLLAGDEPQRCLQAIEILRRWQWDRDLDEVSRQRAGFLMRMFSRRYAA